MLIGRNDYVAWIPCLAWYLGVPLVIRKSRDPPHHRSGWTPDSDYNSFPVSSLYVARPQFLNKWEIRLAERALRIWGIVHTFVPQPILRNVSTPPIIFKNSCLHSSNTVWFHFPRSLCKYRSYPKGSLLQYRLHLRWDWGVLHAYRYRLKGGP